MDRKRKIDDDSKYENIRCFNSFPLKKRVIYLHVKNTINSNVVRLQYTMQLHTITPDSLFSPSSEEKSWFFMDLPSSL